MSIKIGTGSSTPKNVNDVIFGTSSSAKKNVNKVVDWNGKVIWERVTTKDITGNLSYSTDPYGKDFYDWNYDETEYTYTNKFLTIYNVKYTGTSPATSMKAGTDYEVTYTGDTSGKITHSGYGTESNHAVAHIKGIGNYTGQVDVPYTITHENRKYVATDYYYNLITGIGCKLDSTTATYFAGTTYYSSSSIITATISSTDSTRPFVKMGSSGTAYASPHTFTCVHGGSKGEFADFNFDAAEKTKPSIANITPNTTSHIAGTQSDHAKYSPCYTNIGSTIIGTYGFTIDLSNGNEIQWTSSNTHGITITYKTYTNKRGITVLDGEESTTYHSVMESKFTATADGSEYTGSKDLQWYLLQTAYPD